MAHNQIKTNSLQAWILATRPKTLTGAAVPVLTGLAMAWADSYNYMGGPQQVFNWAAAILCLVFALLMQIDANFINDFFDGVRGIDNELRLGPKRACSQGWISINCMKHAIAGTTVLACFVGLPLIFFGGLEMILIGLLCVLFSFLYTTTLAQKGLGDILVLLFFGIVPVSITYYIQLHTISWPILITAGACGIVTDTLLIVNNYRDRGTDAQSDKRTLVVIIGARKAEYLYLLSGIIAVLLCYLLAFDGKIIGALLSTLYLIPHSITWKKMVQINMGRPLNQILNMTARNILLFGILLVTGIILSTL